VQGKRRSAATLLAIHRKRLKATVTLRFYWVRGCPEELNVGEAAQSSCFAGMRARVRCRLHASKPPFWVQRKFIPNPIATSDVPVAFRRPAWRAMASRHDSFLRTDKKILFAPFRWPIPIGWWWISPSQLFSSPPASHAGAD